MLRSLCQLVLLPRWLGDPVCVANWTWPQYQRLAPNLVGRAASAEQAAAVRAWTLASSGLEVRAAAGKGLEAG